jgi:chemotaxis protein CheC
MLTPEQCEMLTEVINAGVVKAGSVLSDLVGHQVRMRVPLVGVTDFTDLHTQLEIENFIKMVAVCQQFHGTMDGYALLLLSRENGNALTQRLTGGTKDANTVETELRDTLLEVGNILTNSVLGTIANTIGHHFEYHVPVYQEGTLPEIIAFSSITASCSIGDSHSLYATAHFDIDDQRIIGCVLILLTAGAFNLLVERIAASRAKTQ